jgi:acetylglutamate kinase
VSANAIGPLVVKCGGELLEPGPGLAPVVRALAEAAAAGPTVIVHGGGREIDADLARRGLPKRAVDGLRLTDTATLEAVVAVLCGTVNTRLVAALAAAGVPAVGTTGADAACVPARPAPAHAATDGRTVDLGLVGVPDAHAAPPRLLVDLLSAGYVPVVASIGLGDSGALLNVNADTLAAHLAGVLRARALVIAGAVAGVLDASGRTLPDLTPDRVGALIADRTASAGMVAKLRACLHALDHGVPEVLLVDGRHPAAMLSTPATRVRRAQEVAR